jgi:hypothetical protein
VNIESYTAITVDSLVFSLTGAVNSLGLLAYPRLLDYNNIRFIVVM